MAVCWGGGATETSGHGIGLGKSELQQDREVVGDAAEKTGALEGAEGFLAGVGRIAGEEEGDA